LDFITTGSSLSEPLQRGGPNFLFSTGKHKLWLDIWQVAGDLDGRFDIWFDGGACEMITGWHEYRFKDGTVAQVGSCIPVLSVTIIFADGRRVHVQQENRDKI
jgi:hypothetical protein